MKDYQHKLYEDFVKAIQGLHGIWITHAYGVPVQAISITKSTKKPAFEGLLDEFCKSVIEPASASTGNYLKSFGDLLTKIEEFPEYWIQTDRNNLLEVPKKSSLSKIYDYVSDLNEVRHVKFDLRIIRPMSKLEAIKNSGLPLFDDDGNCLYLGDFNNCGRFGKRFGLRMPDVGTKEVYEFFLKENSKDSL